jgi:sugar phosphate isomerase/epimerase
MATQFSLAHLTMLDQSPPDLIEIAARAGYDFVSIRPIPVGAPGEPLYPLATDKSLLDRTRAALSATGLRLLDIEVARILPGIDPQSYVPAMEVAAELGGKHVLTSAWCTDRSFILDFFTRLCDFAKPLGLSMNMEFVTWSGIRSLSEAAGIVAEADRDNGGIVVDTLHFDRGRGTLAALDRLPKHWFRFAQVCDGPAVYSTAIEDLTRIGREARLLLGEGGIDVASIVQHLPPVPLSIEVPNKARLAELGPERYAELCLENAKAYLAANTARLAG